MKASNGQYNVHNVHEVIDPSTQLQLSNRVKGQLLARDKDKVGQAAH